jgi:hypothetical protein
MTEFSNNWLARLSKALFQFFGITPGSAIGFDNNGRLKTIPAAILTAVKTVDTVTTEDIFEEDDDLILTLLSGHIYEVTLRFRAFAQPGAGIAVDLSYGTVSVLGVQGVMVVNQTNGDPLACVPAAFDALPGFHYNVEGHSLNEFLLTATVEVNVGGTLQVAWALAEASNDDSTVYKYAVLKAIDITPPA